ncbi:hypothetical protein [Actinophytocola algeriensis]|uniref:Uncharacterized protein n=1 Tax=Actinophytocola algeriensis TaxID=1768010 RepID=A0A7W7Q3D7_9PSEU|nr:hypothetical protein [Actinophytocola algeriensis]MBB4906143.1 hypothetical protein [Actinophytocola algeriensis]MBE1472171.1 hypothetical protein [Actinophytocola algeriensis]
MVDIPSSGQFVTDLADRALFTVLFTRRQPASLPTFAGGVAALGPCVF